MGKDRKPPPPAVTPSPTPPPPATTPGAISNCPKPADKTKVSDCHDIKNHVREGDIVLRSTPGEDSDFIRKASRCDYSHAGIAVKNDAGELVIVDAYPRQDSTGDEIGAVDEESIDDFFCGHGTSKGLVSRPKNNEAAKRAAQWAYEQTKDPDYRFDIFNAWNEDSKRLY